MDNAFISYKINDRSYVSFIKREIHTKIVSSKFNAGQIGVIDIIISEITSNIIKHAGKGEIFYRIKSRDAESTFEIICIDNGPGIEDTAKMMKDGVSTTGTLGQGLGALKRLSTLFQIYSIPGWGTILYSLFSTGEPTVNPNKPRLDLDVKALCVSKPPEIACGDGYRVKRSDRGVQIMLGDGLGHGHFAKEAVDRAGDFFMTTRDTDPVDILRQMHDAVRKTRGLVVSVASFEFSTNQWKLCGVGNILTKMYTGIVSKTHMAYNGALGLTIPHTMKCSIIPIEKNQNLVMCSDGLRTHWELAKYPGILRSDSLIMAAALFKDCSRGTDDASVLVAKVI